MKVIETNSPAVSAPAMLASCAACPVRHLGVCDALSDTEIGRFNAHLTTLSHAPGQIIAQDGDPADWIYILTSGHLKLYKLLADGRRQITGFMVPGDFVGIHAREVYDCSVEALDLVNVCRISRRAMKSLCDEFPQLEHRMLSMVSHDLAEAQAHILLLGRKNARERLASFLLNLSGRRGQIRRSATGALQVILPMTRADLADYLGVTTETVSRTITELKGENIIRLIQRNVIEIPNLERLEYTAEGA